MTYIFLKSNPAPLSITALHRSAPAANELTPAPLIDSRGPDARRGRVLLARDAAAGQADGPNPLGVLRGLATRASLEWIAGGQSPAPEWRRAAEAQLAVASSSQAEVQLAIVPAVRRLVNAATAIEALGTQPLPAGNAVREAEIEADDRARAGRSDY